MYSDRISFEIQWHNASQAAVLLYEIFIESAFILIPLCYFRFPEKLRDSVHVVLYSIVVRMRRLLTSLCQGFVDQNFFIFFILQHVKHLCWSNKSPPPPS